MNMKMVFELIMVSVIFMLAGSLLALPNINAGVFTYKEILGDLILGDIVACIVWMFINSEKV
jgi:hypothetical protein